MRKIYFLVIGLFLLVSLIGYIFYQDYSIPKLIPEDYNCEEHPGFISDSKPFILESSQRYINRKSKAIQKQIEGVCNG